MTVTVNVSEDTWISYETEHQGTNYGSSSLLHLGNSNTDPNDDYGVIYMKFDLTSITYVNSCKLKMYIAQRKNTDPVEDDIIRLAIQAITGTWSEGTLTYTNRGTTTQTYNYTYKNVSTRILSGWVEVDITGLAQQYVGQVLQFTIDAEYSSEYENSIDFSSKEGVNPPYLEIDNVEPSTTEVYVYARADAYIDETEPDTAHGNGTELKVTWTSGMDNYKQALMEFDLSEVNYPIKKAYLKFYTMPTSDCPSPCTIWVYGRIGNFGLLSTRENTVTYNNDDWNYIPSYAETQVTYDTTPTLISVDITSILYEGSMYDCLIVGIDCDNMTGDLVIGSRESDNPPYLYIETYPIPTIPDPILDVSLGKAIIYASEDAYIRNDTYYSDLSAVNFGEIPFAKVEYNQCYAIYKFDVSDIPEHAIKNFIKYGTIHVIVLPDPGGLTGSLSSRIRKYAGIWTENQVTTDNFSLYNYYSNYNSYTDYPVSLPLDKNIYQKHYFRDYAEEVFEYCEGILTIRVEISSSASRFIFLGTKECGCPAWIEIEWNALSEKTYHESSNIATEDTYIDSANPDTNYGTSTTLSISSTEHAYFKFDLSSFTSVDRSCLMFYFYQESGYDSSTTIAFDILAPDWDEDTYTWNSTDPTTLYAGSSGHGFKDGWNYIFLNNMIDATLLETILTTYSGQFTIRFRMYGGTEAVIRSKKYTVSAYRPYFFVVDQYTPEFWVDDTTGNDANDGLSEANAWKTLDHAAKNATFGSIVHLKGDFTNEITGNQIAPTNNGVTYVGWSTSSNTIEINPS